MKMADDDWDVFWINEDFADALLTGDDSSVKDSPKFTEFSKWRAAKTPKEPGTWCDIFAGMSDASGTCEATGLGAPRVAVAFIPADDPYWKS
jgi:hypothetical protein